MGKFIYTEEIFAAAKELRQKGKFWLDIAAELTTRFGFRINADTLRKTLKLALPEGAAAGSDISHFLQKGRTLEEIKKRFHWGTDLALEELHKPFEGLTLFEQRNDFNEAVYILLPLTRLEIEIKPRAWDMRVADDNDPYMWAQFHDEAEEIRIVPIFDVHYGHSAHKHEKFLAYVRWIAETPGVYAVIGGDLMENALDDGRGYSYDQQFHPEKQMLDMVRFLAPIAHKIICMTPGNHELRTKKRAGIDPTRYIADRLKVPYFSGPVIVDFLWKSYRWGAHVFHGNSNSQTKGGKHNAAARPVKFTENLLFYISGHTHDPMANSETRLVRDVANCRLIEQTYWVVVAPSFLHWKGTYAYEANYAPPGKGGAAIVLKPNGDYRADFT